MKKSKARIKSICQSKMNYYADGMFCFYDDQLEAPRIKTFSHIFMGLLFITFYKNIKTLKHF